MDYIRKFFWSTAIGALLMIVSSQTGGLSMVIGKITEFRNLQAQLRHARKVATEQSDIKIQNLALPDGPRNTLEQEQIAAAKLKLPMNDELPEDSTVSDSDMEYVVDGKRYVYIEGKYYEARPDNIYTVNGRKVFFVNNRGRSQREQEIKRRTIEAIEQANGVPMDGSLSPAEMFKQVHDAQINMQRQRQYLNEITRGNAADEVQ